MAAAVATMTFLKDPKIAAHQHTNSLGQRMRSGLTDICEELGVAAAITGVGSVFICYFMEGTPKGYRDLVRNNDRAYAAFHRRMTDKGFMMYPMALKRNHISHDHTEDDIDRTLEAARDVIRGLRDERFFE
jgi:glutamate-1-semialdehyde 2,1-aminomutase